MVWANRQIQKNRVKGIFSLVGETYIKDSCGFAVRLRRLEQTIQYIELVLAQDMMNPLWVFSMGDLLRYELFSPHSEVALGALLRQDGSDRFRDVVIRAHVPGAVGSSIAALATVRNRWDQSIDAKFGYAAVVTAFTLYRMSDNTQSTDYNLYVATTNNPDANLRKPREFMVGDIPADNDGSRPGTAMPLYADVNNIVEIRTCTESEIDVCGSGLRGARLEDIKRLFSGGFREDVALAVVADVRLAVDVGIDCSDQSFLTTCSQIGLDMWDWQDPVSRQTFYTPWKNKNSATGINTNISDRSKTWWASAGKRARGNLVRFRLQDSLGELPQWKRKGAIQGAEFARRFLATRQYTDIIQPVAEIVEATRTGDAPVYEFSRALAITEDLFVSGNKSRILNRNNDGTLASFSAPFEGQYFQTYTFEGFSTTIPPPTVPRRGKGTESTPYSFDLLVTVDLDMGRLLQGLRPPSKIPVYSRKMALKVHFTQTRRARAVQEYWDHNLYGLGHTDEYPEIEDLITPEATTNYTASGGCEFVDSISGGGNTSNCFRTLTANYFADPDPFTYGNPLSRAEDIRLRYSANLIADGVLLPVEMATPLVASAWRNPERNERFGVFASDHQWNNAFDLAPAVKMASQYYFNRIYSPSTSTDTSLANRAAWTWCTLAKASWEENGTKQTLIENSRGSKPSGVNTYYYNWYPDSVTDLNVNVYDTQASTIGNVFTYANQATDHVVHSCADVVRARIEACIAAAPASWKELKKRTLCSPNHVHTAKP